MWRATSTVSALLPVARRQRGPTRSCGRCISSRWRELGRRKSLLQVEAVVAPELLRWRRHPSLALDALQECAAHRPDLVNVLLQVIRLHANLDVRHCNAAISSLARKKHWQHALGIFDEMPALAVSPTVVSFNAAISSCERRGLWPMALQFFAAMEARELQPDVISHNAGISACEKGSSWIMACQIFHRMCEVRLSPTNVSYSALITAFQKVAHWTLALASLNEIPDPDVVCYNTTMTACDRGSAWPWALQLFAAAPRATRSASSFAAAMEAAEKGSQWHVNLELLAQMRELQINADAGHYTACISACERAREWQRALQAFEDLPPTADLEELLKVVEACATDHRQEAVSLFRGLRDQQLQPSEATDRAMSEAVGRLRKAEGCQSTTQTFRHGTYRRHFDSIRRVGLLAGGGQGQGFRNHVHFSPCEPGDKRVISGMRSDAQHCVFTVLVSSRGYDCEIAIWIDLKRAIADNVPFYMSPLLAGAGEAWCEGHQ
ncbi:Pentatricopeptide repeat-containing protein At1g74850 [Durusdinium trenchii]|uniref:Chloroplastic (Protein PLASTID TRANSCRIPTIONALLY ACTIVE 2) n=1 Tax=Durusdinium trenchii TaxID=1381693 RepID=A0ABP0HSN4_9DINO